MSALLVFTVSAIYHCGRWSPRTHGFLKRFDHANIFVLIAGSYTPFALLFLDGSHTEESARRDQDAWVAKLALGGTLAIPDVFPDPADGGQAPYGVYTRVVAACDFTELPGTGSLRLLRRDR